MPMNKLTEEDARSMNIVGENIEQLRAIFPEAFTEGGINFEVLRQLLGDAVEEREEKYGLNWHGKRKARQLALTPSTGTLRPCPEESVDWDTTQNLMIEGDNLEVLKLLQKSYAGQVKLIYIDPPYNTGKDFVYRDNYQDSMRNYLDVTGQTDANGTRVTTNTEASGRFHTDWLNMIYPRLKLARTLLCEDGAIFCSIDDVEAPRLRMLLDDIFGEENFLAQFSWRTDGNFDNQAKVKVCHEYILLYAKSADAFPHPPVVDPSVPPDSKLFRPQIRNTIVKNGPKNPVSTITLPPGFPADFESGTIARRSTPWPRFLNDAVIDNGVLTSATVVESGWSSKDLALEFIANSCQPIEDNKGQSTRFTITRSGAIEAVKERSDSQSHVISVLNGFGGSQKATAELLEMGAFFNGYPKPKELLQYFIKMIGDQDSIILDFFAGSGPIGHAVMAQNAVDDGVRSFILVQLPELLDIEDEAQSTAARYCDKIGVPRNIAELTKERLRRAAKKVRADFPLFAGDLGFRVFKLATSNINSWEPHHHNLPQTLEDSVNHLKADRTESDILFELLLKLGLELTVPIEQKDIAGKTVCSVGGGVLIVCLDPSITRGEVDALSQGIVTWHRELAPAGDTTCVFRDGAFVDDVAKTNLAAILEQAGLAKVRSL